jgi:hypothetical protein
LASSSSAGNSDRTVLTESTDGVVWFALALGALCLLTLLRTALMIRLRIPLNFNEGWNAFHAADIVAGRPLYADASGFFFTNYPPVSFYLIAAIGRLVGDQMLGGRIVALLSLVAWTMLLALSARRLRCSWAESSFAALLFAVQLGVFSDFYVGVNDPQMLGHALQALGLLLLVRDQRSTGSLFVCALLFALGVFTKQNLIALPIAGVAWLTMFDRGAAWRLAAFGTLLAVAGVAACVVIFGTDFLGQVAATRAYVPAKALSMSMQWIPRMLVSLVLAAVLLRRFRRDAFVAFALAYTTVSTLVGLGLSGGEGIYWNTMFDAEWALCLTCALALNRLSPQGGPNARPLRLAMAAGYLAAPAMVVAMSATIHWASPRFWLDPRWFEATTAAREIEFVKQHSGPALCEDLSLCYWAGKPGEVDFFNLQQRARREPWRTDALARSIESRRFGVAELDAPGRDLGPRVNDALQRNYRIDHESQWGVFWVPK